MKGIIINVKQGYADLDHLAKELSNDGIHVMRVYPYGVIKAEANDQQIEKLKLHPNIQEVSIEKSFRLPSPDEDIQ